MSISREVQHVAPGVCFWQTYDAKARSDLFATAVATKTGWYFVDPIPLAPKPLTALAASHPPAGVIVTNANHARDASYFAKRWSVPIFASMELKTDEEPGEIRGLKDQDQIEDGIVSIAIPGAVRGEIAFLFRANNGTLIVGDALINFEPYGFAFLPDKYCTDPKGMRAALRNLLRFDFARMLFAHGTPILSNPRERLEALLASDPARA